MKSELAFIVEQAVWPAVLVDGAGAICRANRAAHDLFGPPLDTATPLLGYIWSPENPVAPERFLAEWEQNPCATTQLRFRTRNGSAEVFLTAVCQYKLDRVLYLFQMLPPGENAGADAKPAADKQKLDRTLQLARTLTLDLNNALTGVLGQASLVMSKLEHDSPYRASLRDVEKAAVRALEIANDLGSFSRQEKQASKAAAGNLNQLVRRAVDALRLNTAVTAADAVEWELLFEKRLFEVKFDEPRLHQALTKILENAVESLRQARSITVSTRNVELTEASQDRTLRLAPGAYVCIEVVDTGCGIAADVLPRIFSPFFTTKRGTHRGLGLALAYGITTNHGGGLAVSSEVNAGTSVRMYLPAEARVVEQEVSAETLCGNGQTILIVDDEEILLSTEGAILSSYGYRVVSANSAEKALKLLAQKAPPVDLVITDLIMPTMSGKDLIDRMRSEFPEVPTICATGYVWPSGQQPRDHEYLRKPFTAQQLLAKVSQALRSTSKEVD